MAEQLFGMKWLDEYVSEDPIYFIHELLSHRVIVNPRGTAEVDHEDFILNADVMRERIAIVDKRVRPYPPIKTAYDAYDFFDVFIPRLWGPSYRRLQEMLAKVYKPAQ